MSAPRALAAPSGSDAHVRTAAGAPPSAARTAGHRHPWITAGATVISAVILLSVALAGSPAAASAPLIPVGSAIADALDETECPVEVPREYAHRVTCGVITVPESRAPDADPSRTLQLPVAVIESSAAEPSADPLVFPTAGGPGDGSLDHLSAFLEYSGWAAEDRDVILVEQRGDARADPSLDCPELDTAHGIVDGVRLSGTALMTHHRTQLQKCHDRLVAADSNLAAYTTAESAADLADLRTALGYDEWNLYGLSYGSRLALTTMRNHPDGLRAVILDGVAPPHVRRHAQVSAGFLTALERLYADCAADAACDAAYPDLGESLTTALGRAQQSPLSVTARNPADGSPVRMDLSDTDLVAGLFEAFSDADAVRVLPFLIDRLARGDADAAAPLAQRSIDEADRSTEGLAMSIECAEEVPFVDDAAIAEARAADPVLAHFALFDGLREDCAVWAVPAAAASENEPVVSGIPTLLANGAYDPVAPRAGSEAAAAHLSNPRLYEFPGMAHGAVWSTWVDDCAASMARQFLREPTVEPDASCISQMAAPDFLTARDIHRTPAIYRFDADVVQDRDPVAIGVALTAILVFAATLVYAAVYGLSWRNRRRGDAPGGAVLAAAASAGLNLIYVGGLAAVMMRTDPLVLAFGLPAGAWPLLLAPFAALGAAVLLIVLLVLAWRHRDGTLTHRVLLSISAAASVVFAMWLLTRGLLAL